MNVQWWAHWLPTLGFCMLRPLGAVLIVPVFNRSTLGGSLSRNALALLIALPLTPLGASWPTLDMASGAWPVLLWIVCSELLVGVVIGFAAAVPFWALDMAGSLIDTMRGATMANVLNPMLGQQSSLLGALFSQIFGLLFIVTGGLNELIVALYDSYRTVPPALSPSRNAHWLAFLMRDWQLMYELGLRFAMPALIGILLVDMALGLVNRSAQQLNVFFLSMPVKSAFAALLIIVSMAFAFRPMIDYSVTLSNHVQQLLSARP